MIAKPTVLILGAGASCDYGFPSGRDLLLGICRGIDSNSSIKTNLIEAGFVDPDIAEFRMALDRSGQPSVDAFLENREDYLSLGKTAIACHLIPFENAESFTRTGVRNGWYEYLWHQLNAPKSEFCANRLSVITFNYDRSLECYLSMVLRNSYGLSDAEVAVQLQHVPIVHIHGQLGEFSPLPHVGRKYEPTLNKDAIRTAVDGIKVVHEATDSSADLDQAYQLLSEAEVVCFLGFGYHDQNMIRLRLDQINWAKKKTYWCFYGFKPIEQANRAGVPRL